jgi:hypothetical protein
VGWNWQSTCSACEFVTAQFGRFTPCLFHAGRNLPAAISLTDDPGSFTVPEYGRLLMLRSRFRARRVAG